MKRNLKKTMPSKLQVPQIKRPRSLATTHLSYACPRSGIPSAMSFRKWVDAALSGAKTKRVGEVSIRLVELEEARQLNLQFRQRDYATNVLSFECEPMPKSKATALLNYPLGDLVICVPVVRQEARQQGKQSRDHFAHLCIHGVLHLLGFDHLDNAEAEKMEALEVKILSKLGIANPYCASEF